MDLICILVFRHNESNGAHHLQLHELHVLGVHASTDDGLFLAFSSVWMMLNYFRQVNSQWPIQIMSDATFKFCDQDIGLIGMGIMTPGGKLQPLIYAYSPTESADAYKSVWKSLEKSLLYFAKKFIRCADVECATCNKIDEVLQHKICVESMPKLREEGRLAVDFATSDHSMAHKKFAQEDLGLGALYCISHLRGIYPDHRVFSCIHTCVLWQLSRVEQQLVPGLQLRC